MDFNYKLYSSFLISTIFHLAIVMFLSLVVLPKEPLPKTPLEIELVKVVPPSPPVVKKKIKKVVRKKSKKVKRVKKRVVKKAPVVVKKPKPKFKYTPSTNADRFFSEATRSMSRRHINTEGNYRPSSDLLLEDVGKLSSIEERMPADAPKIKSFVNSGTTAKYVAKRVAYTLPLASSTSPDSVESPFEKITWESGVARKRIYSPPVPSSHSSITGKVVVAFWVDGAGFVTKYNLRRKLSAKQDQVALSYVRGFKFEPDSSLKLGERHKGAITILFENVY